MVGIEGGGGEGKAEGSSGVATIVGDNAPEDDVVVVLSSTEIEAVDWRWVITAAVTEPTGTGSPNNASPIDTEEVGDAATVGC